MNDPYKRPPLQSITLHPQAKTFTSQLFPGARHMLQDHDNARMIRRLTDSRSLEQYYDLLDFLFCALLVGFRDACQKFYKDSGPPLKEFPIMTREHAKRWDALLMGAILLAAELGRQNITPAWCKFREMVLETAVSSPQKP